MVLELLEKEYSVYKFDPKYILKEEIIFDEFISITKTNEETSIVIQSGKLNEYIKMESGWKILKINGILDFSLIGILSKIGSILAKEKISIFVISTYNTDYIMIKEENIKKAMNVLIKNNYKIK
jgi:hypothetical protein